MSNLENSIAIIGMSGRFPGAKNIDQFWQNLRNGVEAISSLTDEELLTTGIEKSILSDPNYVKAGAFLENIDLFDASFFGINPREAENTDPQHRIFLESAWEALENAGYNSETYSGRIGTYAGVGSNNYLLFNIAPSQDFFNSAVGYQTVISNEKDFLTTRVSYHLNLTGLSVDIQTACSTSLVAVCMACQSLLNYQCDITLAGGISISALKKTGYFYQEGGILSPDGHCRAFDAKAKGTVPGSGVGIVVLKRLEDAIEDGDRIHAVIRGWGLNNDGAMKVGYTAPSIDGQAEVIAEALALAGVEPETISYIETHGTGTPLGDPIEIAALDRVFRASTDEKGFCAIGSVKTNVGHLDAAAGVTGLIKTVLALEHKLIPPSLHFEQPNPQIDFANSPFYVNNQLTQWNADKHPRRAGVSSFGIGGTNAHIILEEAEGSDPPYPSYKGGRQKAESRKEQLLVLSAKTQSALDKATANLASYLQSSPDVNLADVAYTLQVGRKAFEYRRFVVCKDVDDAVKKLTPPTHYHTSTSSPSIAFLFPGQGSQYVNMGRELYESEPIFQKEIDRCCQLLQPYLNLDLFSLIYPPETETQTATEQLKQTSIAQPAIFVIEYALAQLWMSWGIKPQATIGHSIGEYVAATLAGVFDLEDALKLVAIRGQLMQQLPQGAMLAVSLSEKAIKPLLNENIALAAVNSSSNCVVSGQIGAIKALQQQLTQGEIGCRFLHTSHAFHSSMMDAAIAPFLERVKQVNLHPPQMPYLSNVTGTWITTEQATDPHYWATHLRQTVRFADGLQTLLERSHILLEVGAGRTLSTLAQYSLAKTFTSLRHPKETRSDRGFILNTLGQLWQTGIAIDWSGFYNGDRRQRLPLPTYPFERQRYWVEEGRRTGHSRGRTESDADERSEEHRAPQPLQMADGRRRDEGRRRKPEYTPPKVGGTGGQISVEEDRNNIWDLVVNAAQKQALTDTQLDRATYLHKKQCLDRLCIAYINQALRKLGAFSLQSDKYSFEELLEQCQILPRYRQLLHRWLQVLVEQGQLQEDGGYFSNLQATASIHSLLDEVRREWADTPQEIDLLQNCGDNLATIVTGKKEALEFHVATLTEAGDIARQNSPLDNYYNTILRSSLEAMVKSSDRLNILEIGGGTGIATAELLPILPAEQTRYTFTDVGGLFLTQAQKKFDRYPFVDYRVLDIEKSPSEQGFDRHSFDVVVAVNVLHVARNLSQSLEYIRALLAPEGFLLIREITEPQLDFDITDGLLMNPVEDEARLHGNPFLSRDKWRETLLAHGFDRVEIVPETDAFGQQIIFAQKSSETVDKKRDLDEWFYIPSWKRSLLPISSFVEKQRWLLFVDECGIGEKIEQRLVREGQEVISVQVGEEFGCDRDREYTINPQQRKDYFTLFEALKGKLPSRIVYFWGVNPSDRDEFLSRTETQRRREGSEDFYGLLWLAQALGEENLSDAVEVAIVSNDMQAVTGSEELCPMKSLLLGACKVISQEYPKINCRSIDIVLPSYRKQEEQLLEQLLAEIGCPPNSPTLGELGRSSLQSPSIGEVRVPTQVRHIERRGFRGQVHNSNLEQIIAYRGNHRWVQTYEPIQLNSDRTIPLREKGVYLITGGLGGIGLVLAQYLAQKVQAKLALVGRSEFPAKETWREWLATHEPDDEISCKIRQIQAIEALGTEVAILKADVTILEQMQQAIAHIHQQFGQIHGVIHAAGVTPGGTIQTKTVENAESILAPKVKGTLVLDTLFEDVPLDFLILCSSLTSVLGGVGMADHCAANAFMDAFAYADAIRNDKRLTISVNWDSWQEVGQAAKTEVPKSLQKLREESLKQGILPQEGVKAFERILNSTVPQILVSTRNLEGAFLETEKLQSVQPKIDLRSRLLNDYIAPTDEVESAIANIWQEYLGITPIGIHDDFFNLGGDSLLAVQIVSQIRKIFSVELKVNTLLSEATTIDRLANVIKQRQAKTEEISEIEKLLSELESLSPEEIQAELNTKT